MNSNNNVRINYKKRTRNTIISAGMHPEGGFIAWPNGKTSRTKNEWASTQGTCVNRKGFVAWPSEESRMAY